LKIPEITRAAFCWPIQIYWEDTDAGGVVYHSNYLKFFERARSEWLREKGVVQTELAKLHGVVFVLRGVTMQYLKPARMDDGCVVWLAPAGLGRASLSVRQELRRRDAVKDGAGEVLCRADVDLACVDASSFLPKKIPNDLYELLANEQQA
jgi:acyl-CoA thioester hydrolase